MSLNDFLADASQGKTSWADEMDDLPMPAPRDSYRRTGGDSLANAPDRGFDRQSYPPRDELPLPDKPPYTAFVGNLAFDVMDSDIEQFFAPANVISVRIVSGHDGKPKGFGYIEFQTLDDLKNALNRSGSQMVNRTVRVSVAEPPKSAFGGGGDRMMMQDSKADDASQWRRSAPLPPSEPRGGFGARPERTQRTFESGPGFDAMDVSGGVRSGFGAKFQAAPPASARPPPRDMAPLEPSLGDQASQWRTGKPVEARSPALSRPDAPNSDSRRPSYRKFNDANEVDERFASQERMGFGSKFNPEQTPPDTPGNGRRSFGLASGDRRASGTQAPAGAALPPAVSETQENWRSAKKPITPSGSPGPVPASAERKRLELKPRSAEPAAAAGGAAPSPTAATSSAKPSPFGNAKPVDASEREKEIEQKLSQKEKERQEELKAKKEKIKAERAAAAAASPTQSRPEKKERAPGARKATASVPAEAPAGDAAAAKETESPKPAPTAAAKAASPRPAPTGAWGGGRKPSGALNADGTLAAPETNGTSDEHQAEQVADKLQETTL